MLYAYATLAEPAGKNLHIVNVLQIGLHNMCALVRMAIIVVAAGVIFVACLGTKQVLPLLLLVATLPSEPGLTQILSLFS